MGRPHLHDVLAKIAAIKYDVSETPGHQIIPTVSRPAAPLEIAEHVGTPVRFIFFHIQGDTGLEARPFHVGIGAREDHLEAARHGMIAATVHDPAAVDACNPGGADAVVAVRWRLRLCRRYRQQEERHRGREGRQSGEGGGGVLCKAFMSTSNYG